jgi:hypothetical protein
MNGIELIAEARRHQVEDENFGPERDDQYTKGQLAVAAAIYAIHHTTAEVDFDLACDGSTQVPQGWPWGRE